MTAQKNNWILNTNSTVTLSDYQRHKLAKTYQKLAKMSVDENDEIKTDTKKTHIFEMNLKDLGEKFIRTWTQIIPEFYMWIAGPRNLQDLMEIFVQEDRMIYVGLMCILVGLFCYFFLLPE